MPDFHKISKTHLALAGLAVLVSVGAVFGILGCSQENQEAKAAYTGPRLVKAGHIKTTGSGSTHTFPGVVQPAAETKLAFRVGGPLVSIDASIGRKVSKGDIIARIDPRDFKVRVDRLTAAVAEAKAGFAALKTGARPEDLAALQANLSAAKSRLAETKANFERYEALYKENAVAKSVYDSAKTGFEMATAKVTAAQNQLAKGKKGGRKEEITAMEARIKGLKVELSAAQNALRDTELKAPFEGYVNHKFVENFETVAPGRPIISLLDVARTEVRTSIPHSLMRKRSQWKSILVRSDYRQNLNLKAKIKEIGHMTQGPSQSFPLVVTVENPQNHPVLPGVAANVSIHLSGGAEKEMEIPAAAVFALPDGGSAVWRIDPKSMTIHSVPVKVISINNDKQFITGNIKPADLLVMAGARFLRQGQKVRVMKDGKGGPA